MENLTDTFQWPIIYTIPVVEVPPSGKHLKFAADNAQCTALAAYLEVPAVSKFTAEMHIKPTSSGDIWVNGSAHIDLTYECGVSLTPYDDSIDMDIKAQYVDAARRKDIISKWDLEDDVLTERIIPEEIADNAVNIGALLCELVAVELNPFPRKPDAAFTDILTPDEDDKPASPFAVLKGKV